MYENLTLSDIQCPVCMDICILPVTLPCGHVYCEYCLRNTVQHQACVCPKCRKRIGTFLRKNKNIVNLQLWAAIQDQYPVQVDKKQNGEDSGVSECIQAESVPPKPTYTPGEIREEFERSIFQESEKDRIKREKEEEASAKLIKELQEEEEKREEERRKQLLIDEELARSFVERGTEEKSEPETEIRNPSPTTRNMAFSTPKATTPTRKLESYFQSTPTTSRCSSGDDSISQEIHHFKPISTAPTTPPKLMPDGSSANNHILMVQPNKTPAISILDTIKETPSTSGLLLEVDETDEAGPSIFNGQDEILFRAKENDEQMKNDWLFALELKKQWDLEEKNARKRTGNNAFNLRHNSKKVKRTSEPMNKQRLLTKVKNNSEPMSRQSTLCRVGCHCCK